MKRLFITSLVIAGFLATQLPARAELSWSTDAKAALEQAKKEKKMVLMDFTGSDWCGWCIKLKKDVFDTKEFGEYAGKKQSAELKKANDALLKKHRADGGFPTIVVLNSDGKEVWRKEGYMAGGPKAWIAALDEAKKK